MWDSYLGELNRLNGDFGPFLQKPKSKFDNKGTPFVIEAFTPHQLRHTFCTLLYRAGVDVLTAAEQMGHADPKVTLAKTERWQNLNNTAYTPLLPVCSVISNNHYGKPDSQVVRQKPPMGGGFYVN